MKMGEETRRLRFTKLLSFLFLLAFCIARARAFQDDGWSDSGIENAARVQRDLDGVTTVLLVSARSGKGAPPLGLLTKTARTFVQDGASTEYATQVLGTTLANGRLYARILSTSSRVFYDRDSSISDPSSPDPFIVYPSRVPQNDWQFGIALDNAVANSIPSKNSYDVSEGLPPALDELLVRENDVFERKETSPVDLVKFRPAKVRNADNLPTYTVKQDAIYNPEVTFSKESSVSRGFTPRMPKIFGIQSRPEPRKVPEPKPVPLERLSPQKPLGTVTYHGFADFTTTVGDTVIVFSPSTAPAPVGRPATTIKGDATLRPDDGVAKEIQATSVIVGHWKTNSADPGRPETPSDPLLEAVNGGARRPQLQPSVVHAPEPQETTTSTPSLPNLSESTGLLSSIVSSTAVDGTTTLYKSLIYGTYFGTDYAQVTHTASDVYFFPDETSTFGSDESEDVDDVTMEYTDTESKPTTEQITPEMNELTTPFKDTTVNPPTTVKQVPPTLPKEEEPMKPTEPTPSVTSGIENEIPNDITLGDPQGRSIKGPSEKNNIPFNDDKVVHQVSVSKSSTQLLQTRLPSTIYKTFTYFTTFFIPGDDDRTTTSVRSREVVSAERTYVSHFIAPSTSLRSETVTTETPTTPKPEERETTAKSTSPVTTPMVETSSEAVSEQEEEQTTVQDEEIELIFKTLYTTYTYLTTYFQEQTSSVSMREVIETNVITQTVGPYYDVSADVAGLFDRDESVLIAPTRTQEVVTPSTASPSAAEVTEEEPVEDDEQPSTTEELRIGTTDADDETEIPTEAILEPTPPVAVAPQVHQQVVKTYYTTYTYFTSIFVDGETETDIRTEVFTNVVTGSIQPSTALPTTQQSEIPATVESPTTQELPKSETTDKPQAAQVTPSPDILAYLEAIQKKKSQEEALRLAKEVQAETASEKAQDLPETTEAASATTLIVESDAAAVTGGPQVTPNPPEAMGDGEVLGSMVTDVVSSSSSGGGTLVDAADRKINTFPEDQELSESNNHEVEPVATLLLQTSYTTFTYFTTMYKGDASNVVSRLETVTNVATETIRPSVVESQTVVPTSTAPLTHFTTFTYWTTYFKGGDTLTTSHEETVSNIATEGIDPSPATATSPLPTRDITTTTEVQDEVNEKDNEVTSQTVPVTAGTTSTTEEIGSTADDQVKDVEENKIVASDELSINPDPTTFYTTFTYFTTSYVGNSTVLSSRLETITSVAERSDRATGRAVGGGAVVPTVQALGTTDKPSPSRVTGLISTVRTSEVTDGTTTHFATDVRGTYIDGLYAQIIESSTRIEKPEDVPSSSTKATPVLPTGVLSLNRGSIIDADEITTVYYTTRQVGTTVDDLYAKIVESTSSTKIDEEKLATFTPTQTGTHRTGLVRLIEGFVETNNTTVFYRSKVIGTSIDGRYAQIIESTSSWLSAAPVATASGSLAASIAPSATDDRIAMSSASFLGQVHPSPAVVQSSMSDDPTTIESSMEDSTEDPGDQGDEEADGEKDENEDSQKSTKKSRLTFSSRTRSFTPVIRPFASRNRPTFNPKRKGAQGATTITRTDITPTVTATLAGKGNRFASSRSRLNSPNGPYSSSTGSAQQSSGSRRFPGRRSSSTSSIQPSSGYPSGSSRGRASSRISPSSVFSGRGRGPSSIGAIRSSSVRPGRFSNSAFASGPAGSSRYKSGIRASSTLLRGQQSSARNYDQDDNANDYTATTLVTEETPYTEDDRYDDGETGETGTVPLQTTTESVRRTTNPLLRFRRPLTLGQTPRQTGATQRPPTTTTRRSGNLARAGTSTANRSSFTPLRSNNRPNVPISTRPRQSQQNSLFPPRGLFNRKPEPTEPTETTEQTESPLSNDEGDDIQDDEENFEDDEPIEDVFDNDFEGSEQEETSTNRRSGKFVSPSNGGIVRIRPFAARGGRVRRQASQLRSLTANRFRRPPLNKSNSPQTKAEDKPAEEKSKTEETSTNTPAVKPTSTSRYGSSRSRPLSGYRPSYNKNNKQDNDDNDKKTSEESTSSPPAGKPKTSSRSKSRPSGSRSSSRIKPTSASNSGRQFTLREKDSGSTRSGYKRPSSSSSRSRSSNKPETSSRPRPPRIRSGGSRSSHTESPPSSKRVSSDSRSRSGSRSSSNGRNSNGRRPSSKRHRPGNTNSREDSRDIAQPEFDGTITVTHYVPTEVTIPVVNNGVTERKNIITAHPSTQILGPDRYSTVIGGDGRPLIVIGGDVTGTNAQGQTEITRFLLHESVTTSITRGPTTIGGRRTTYSHVIPSTVYSVENVVSTRQPTIPAANAPLANILLSQLLLGQLGQGNPLLGGLQQQQQQLQQPATPSTRFDTRTTSYVTTITKHQSTVIPLTFRGKEILTTLVDSSINVITATEYITDTIVVTPTAALAGPDINSLLLLLQQPQQPQQANLFDPLFSVAPAPVPSITLPGDVEQKLQSVDSDYKQAKESDSYDDDVSSNDDEEENNQRQRFRGRNASSKQSGGKRKEEVPPAEESSVVTLYVSGRRPGEFSTVLSTVRVGEDATTATSSRRKRDAEDSSPMIELKASRAPSLHAAPESIEGILALVGSEGIISAHSPTQSLESVVGHFQEFSSPLNDDSSTIEITDQDDSQSEIKIPLPNFNDDEIDSTVPNRPRKRLRVRVPVSRADGNHKITVVRRRPLVTLSRAGKALPTPRRFTVTRVRTSELLRTTEYEGRTEGPAESEAEGNDSITPRHKVTVTRRRKIQPTSNYEHSIKPRVTRKKLVNVRPVLLPTPTPTPTLAIITTGFYGASASSDEYSDLDDEAYDDEDEDISAEEYGQDSTKIDELLTGTPGLDKIPNTIENKSNEIANQGSETTTESNLPPVTPPQPPVILTDHFFLPSDEEENYDDEDVDDDANPPEDENTSVPTTEETFENEKTSVSPAEETVPDVDPGILEPSPSVSIQESPPKTIFVEETPELAITPGFEIPVTTSDDDKKPSTILKVEEVTVEPLQPSTKSSESRIVLSTSPPLLEDAVVGSSDDPVVSLSQSSSISNLPPNREDPTSSATVPKPTAIVYYSETVVTSTRLRTYTYVVTKLNGLQTEVTSSTAVKPKVTTLTLTVPVTANLPQADLATSLPTNPQPSSSSLLMTTSMKPLSPVFNPETIDDDESAKEEPEDEQGRRFNLATRRMSNGVQVIVAGPTPAPAPRWETASPPATLTLSDAVVMLMPRDKPQEFVTKTCATTFTYLTTFTDKDGSARVSTKHQVVYNTATEEKHLPADTASQVLGFTLEASPTLATEVFETTYAYLDLPVDSRGGTVITNTVTAPQRYLDLVLEPSEAPLPETNTYLSTRTLERTITENGKATVQAVNDVVTRLVVTESARSPRPSTNINSTLSSAADVGETTSADLESDVVKTYYITYSYYSTFLEHGSTVVRTNVATSSDVVTEKAPARRTTNTKTALNIDASETIETPVPLETSVTPVTPTISANSEPFQILATKTYLTTFTYFTTLLQAGADGETSTTVSSRSQIVENVVTESITPSVLDAGFMNALLTTSQPQKEPVDEPSEVNQVNNVVTGSTIIFFDEEDRIDPTSTSTAIATSTTEAVPVSPVTPGPETDPTTLPTTGENAKVPEASTDIPSGGSGSFGNLGPFGSFGINGLSALGPVITAMAGLLQGKTSASRRNGTSDDDREHQDVTTQRSPIYIPVAEFADGDIETAESQNIGNRLANLNRNYIPETRHKSSASLVNGIPISPGEVITANSDVIIGKPGKIGGPRPPQTYNREDEHGGIRPPPPPLPQALLKPARPHVHRATPTEHHETHLQILPARQVFEEHLQIPVEYGVGSVESHQVQVAPKHPQRLVLRTDPGHDVMVNDPLLKPPASPNSSNERGKPSSYNDRNPGPDPNEPDWSPEKYRRPWSAKDPLKHLESQEISQSSGAQWIRNDAEEAASTSYKVQGSPGKPNSWPNHHDRESSNKNHERPPWAQRDPILPANTIVESSLQPNAPEPTSIIRHVVPHVIDRDTGQPLLVNIQPSQVANVVIPQGGNQALIFGDTNEPHITGQYFDDPSPYPEPEVAPGFVAVQKVEHSPQYYSQDDPSEYMVPPPSPHINFKPLPQSPGSRPPTHHERPGGHARPGVNYNQISRRPVTPPATSPPRRTEVETPPHRYIFLGKPGDSRPANEMSSDSLTWKLKPVAPPSTTQSTIRQRPPGHFGSSPNRPTTNSHDIYIGRPGTYAVGRPQYPSVQPPLPPLPPPPSPYRPMTKKPNPNLVPPNWTPPKNSFSREPVTPNDIVVAITETVPVNSEENHTPQILHPSTLHVNVLQDPETPHYHNPERIDPLKLGTTESSSVQQSTGENLPTGAVEYHDPSIDPKVKPEDTSYYPRIPTVKPEVQSFGQILPQDDGDRAPEIWTVNTQTERSSLSNDSEISESQKVKIHTSDGTRGDMPPEIDNDTDDDAESDLPLNYVTAGSKDPFDNVGSVTTLVGKPLEVGQAVAYGEQQQKKHEQQQQQGQNVFTPHRGAPFAHRDQEPAIVQGVPFRQDPYEGTKPYERPMIVKGKPFGVYVDGHVNVGRPYGYDQREKHRPPISHDVVQGVPFGHHGNQIVVPQSSVHQVPVPPRKDNGNPSTISPHDRGDVMDLKPPPVGIVFHPHQTAGQFGTNRPSGNVIESKFGRPETVTLPPTPSSALSPPAKPIQTNKDFNTVTGNRSRPNSMNPGNNYGDESGSELNFAETAYQLPHDIITAGQTRPDENSGSFNQGRPTFQPDITRPKPPGHDVKKPQQANDRVELEFSMPVEPSGDDDGDSDTQTERPPSMFSGTSTTRKPPVLPTNLTAPPPVNEVSINREKPTLNVQKNNSHPVIQESIPVPQPRPRPKVPYRDMMPPPLRPSIVFHSSKVNGNENKDQSEGLKPPPLPTEVVGLSPPPAKYIPLEQSTTPAARPFIVEILSQDMVPPAPVIDTPSRPVQEVATVRPAVAVSGSIRIATSVATAHVPLMHDIESEIPVIHGTVDLPVIIEMPRPPPSKSSIVTSKTSKTDHVSIYTARPFESRPISRVSIQPTGSLSTSLTTSSTTTLRQSSIYDVEPSRSSTYSVTFKPTRLSSVTTEFVTDDPTTTNRPGKPVLLQPSKDTDLTSVTAQPTQSLASIEAEDSHPVTKHQTKIHEKSTPKTSTRTKDPEIETTTSQATAVPKYSKTTTNTPRNKTEPETVLYVVTTRVESGSSSTTRTLLLTRTLTSTTVETVTETFVHPASPTTIISSSTILRPNIRVPVPEHERPSENESILVVISDQHPPESGAEEVEAEYGDEDMEPTRDEQDPVGNEIQRVLAGGILGAPVFPRESIVSPCQPECRASKSEVCAEVNGDTKCVCRPGFARMFLDRPCKPIYTYTLRVGLDRVGKDSVSTYVNGLNDTASTEYQKLAAPTKDALDRTMMQSDLRDFYRGLDVARFTSDPGAGVEFHVQFSENANETRLKEVVRKYLVGNNYSLGGTEVYASRDLDSIDAMDFDECATEEGGPHHDCSPHAACFNLRGSYQCSCREGWADLSDNLPVYPGRVCSQAPLGCPACNNKGHCLFNTNGQEVCECFPWHSGQRCQVNLKVLLIALVTTGIVLLILLGACVGLACLGKPGRRSGNRSGDRRAMIPGGGDTSSEGSAADLATIPHHVPHVLPAPPQMIAPAPPSKRPSGVKRTAPSFTPAATGAPAHPRNPRGSALSARPRDSVRSKAGANPAEEQRDRSLTVMIPRAKYRSAPQSPQAPNNPKPPGSNLAADERKLINYLEGGPRSETRKPSLTNKRETSVCKEIIADSQTANRTTPTNGHLPVGALVSAGFQVSATVTRPADAESTLARSCGETTVEPSTKILRNSDVLRGDLGSTLARSCGETTIQAPTKLLRMDLGEAGSTLARSCGETTIQPPTKMAADRRGSREPRDNASDGHTMAERDVGGTLRMPAQRPPFYDPDRASDRESNFDSL